MTDKPELLTNIKNEIIKAMKIINNNKSSLLTEINFNNIYSLLSSNDPDLNEIISLLTRLNKIIKEEPELFTIIFPVNNKNYFLELIVQIYLKNLFLTSKEASLTKNLILSLITKILIYYNCNWETYEIIHEFLGKYFRKEHTTPEFTSDTFSQLLTLIERLYGVIGKSLGNNESIQKVNYLPKSFFIHNGNGEMKRIQKDDTNIENGINIIMWFYVKNPPRNMEDKSILIEFVLKDKSKLTVELDNNTFCINLIFNDNIEEEKPVSQYRWHKLDLILIPKSLFSKPSITITITNFLDDRTTQDIIIKKEFPKDFMLQIKSMNFYSNFYGLSTSIFILSNPTKPENKEKQKPPKHYSTLKYGGYNISSSKYYYELFKNRLISCYTPYNSSIIGKKIIVYDSISDINMEVINYIETSKQLIQILSHLKGNIIFVNNCFNSYSNVKFNIQYIGGISTFLPLFYLMIEHDKILMTPKIFEHIMTIITGILTISKYNFLHAINKNFFYLLSRLLEIIPSYVFNERIFICLSQIKELFELYYNFLKLQLKGQENNSLSNSFFEYIYFNMNIINKFTPDLQHRLFETINDIITDYVKINDVNTLNLLDNNLENSDNNSLLEENEHSYFMTHEQIKPFCNMNIISKFLYHIDKNKYRLFCCKAHAIKNALNIMKPTLIEKIKVLKRLIVSILEKDLNTHEEMFTLFNLLCLDLSPCLQIFCIDILKYFIRNLEFQNTEDKIIFKTNCQSNQIQKIIFHLIKDSIWEIKLKAIELLLELSNKIENFLNDEDVSILKEVIITDAIYKNINEIKYNKKAKSLLKLHSLNVQQVKRNNSESDFKKAINNYKQINRLSSKNNEVKLNKQNKLLQELHFSDEYISQMNNYINEDHFTKNNYKIFDIRKCVLIIDTKIIEIYKILMSWMNKLSSSNYHINLANQIFSIIISFLHKSLSFALLQTFLKDLKDNLNKESFIHFIQFQELIHFLLETTFHFLNIKNIKCINEYSIYFKINQPTSINTPQIIQTLLDILTNILVCNLKNNLQTSVFEYLLNWVTYHQIVSTNKKYLYLFIETLFQETINKYLTSIVNISNLLDNKISLYNNLAVFINVFFEYLILQTNNLLLITDPVGYIDINNYLPLLNVPCFLLTWVNMNTTVDLSLKKYNKFNTANKYTLYKLLFLRFQHIWNIFRYCNNSKRETATILSNKKKLLDQLIEQFIYCSKKSGYNVMFKELEFLFLPNVDNKQSEYEYLPLIKIFFNYLIISIALIGFQENLAMILEEFENYIIFIIIASLNSYALLNEEQNKIITSIIAFSLNFILEQYNSTTKNKKKYEETIDLIFYVLYNILSHKKFKSIFEKTPLYLLFYEYIVDDRGYNLIVHYKKFDIKLQKKIDFSVFYNKERNSFWNDCLTKNSTIQSLLKDFFGKKELSSNIHKRYLQIKSIYPLYNVNKDKSKDNLIKALDLKLNKSFICKEHKKCFKLIDNHTIKQAKVILKSHLDLKTHKQKVKLSKAHLIKKTINSLFKFRGSWSDKNSFYVQTSNLRNKVINHYTSDMTMPFLSPILNKDYPLLLSRDKNYKYLISYNAELFFNKTKQKYKKNQDDITKSKTNLDKIYKKIDSGNLWTVVKNYKTILINSNDKKVNEESTMNQSSEMNSTISNSFISIISKKTERTTTNTQITEEHTSKFNACLVKQTYHIKGYIKLTPLRLTFKSQNVPTDKLSVDNTYSFLSFKCRGSIHKDSIFDYNRNIKQISILIKKIKYIFIRNYYFLTNAFEIFTSDNKGYYFHFTNETQLQNCINKINKDLKPLILEQTSSTIGYYNPNHTTTPNDYISFDTLEQNWNKKHSISTLNFIMWLNILSGRSYKDVSKYPIFPWPIMDYTSKIINKLSTRNFDKPMGMLVVNNKSALRKNHILHTYKQNMIIQKENQILYTNKQKTSNSMLENDNNYNLISKAFAKRKEDVKYYEEFKAINNLYYYYKYTYSTKNIVLPYLLRIYPFKSIYGKNKSYNTFNSIEDSFNNAVTHKDDYKELTPEFYYMCEFLLSSSSQHINDVILPQWSKNKPYEIISAFRKTIEEDPNKKIHKWIELIFGINQRDSQSHEHHNCFSLISYQEQISLNEKDEILKPVYLHLLSKGMIPNKIIHFPLQPVVSSNYNNLRKMQNTLITEIQYKYIDKPHLIYPIYFKSQNNQITIVLSDLSIHTFMVTDFNKKYSIDHISDVILNETIDDLYRKQMYNNIRTLVIYKQNSIIKGGYCDGTIKHFYKGDGKLTYSIINLEHNNSPITAIALTSNQKTIIFGTQKGALMIYAIPPMKNNDQLSLSKLKVINDHSDEIIEITLNENLQIIATSSYDEYIFIYTIPTYKCIRSFKFPNFYADNIIISSNPLPVIVLYCEECSEYKLFTLNGSVIDINDTYITNQGIDLSDEIKHKVITCFGMYTDSKYVDHLIMGTDDGCVIIREFPTLKVEVFVKVFDEDTSNVTVKYVLPILNGNGVLVYGNNKKTFKLITNKL